MITLSGNDQAAHTYHGRSLLTAQPASRPTLAQRVIALALADRAEATPAQHHANDA